MQLAEDMLVYIAQDVLRRRRPELEALERDLTKLAAIVPPFPRISYDEAAAILAKEPESTFKYGDDFGAPDETIISNSFDRPVLVHRYPHEVKSFYMKRDQGPAQGALRRRPRQRGRRGDHRRQPARGRLRDAQGAHRREQAAARGLRVVPRPAALRQRAALGLRAGPRAHGRLAGGRRARARGEPVPADDVPALALSAPGPLTAARG